MKNHLLKFPDLKPDLQISKENTMHLASGIG